VAGDGPGALPGVPATLDDEVGFDAHRRTGRCVPPSSLGLIVAGGVWGGRPVGERTTTP